MSEPVHLGHELAELADCLEAGAPVPPAIARCLAPALRAYLAHLAPTLDAALGLAAEPGRRDWRTAVAITRRDALLQEAAARHFAGEANAVAAVKMASGIGRYAATGWPRERDLNKCPRRRRGRVEEYFWRVLKEIDHVPSERTIRRALATS